MIAQNFNTGRLVTNKNNHLALATAVENYFGPRTVPILQKHVKAAINSDTSQTYKNEDGSDKVVRKYITVKVLNKSVRFQLDSGSDLSIITYKFGEK